MADLSLLPNQAKFQAAKIRLKEKIDWISWFSAFIFLAVLLIVYSFYFLGSLKLNSTMIVLQKAEKQYSSMSSDLLISRQVKINAKLVGKLLNERFEYGKAYNRIANVFLSPKIRIDKSQLEEQKKFSLSGVAIGSEGIDSVEKKVKDINNGNLEDYKDAKITSLSVDGEIWKFAMEARLK